jgi:predicted DNA-binding transcriptional regulator AlpA
MLTMTAVLEKVRDGAGGANRDRLLDTREAARQLGLSPSYLAKRRITGGTDSPVFIKLGKLVRYAQKDIDAYLDSRRRRSTSEVAG